MSAADAWFARSREGFGASRLYFGYICTVASEEKHGSSVQGSKGATGWFSALYEQYKAFELGFTLSYILAIFRLL